MVQNWRFLGTALALVFVSLSAQASQSQARMMVHLLDYIAVDYSMAVEQGEVINTAEFAEMQEFASTIKDMMKDATGDLQSDAQLLQDLVEQKASQNKIASVANSLKQGVISHYDLEVGPKRWPKIERGAKLYKLHCGACHGEKGKGNGAMAEGLKPQPTNFHAPDKAEGLSPFQAYNTIRLGVEGTSMRAFDELNDDEVWDLAFYVISLPYREKEALAVSDLPEMEEKVKLSALASEDNKELRARFDWDAQNAGDQAKLSALRLYPRKMGRSPSDAYISNAIALVEQSISLYENNQPEEARTSALTAYLEGVEPVEMQLRANNAPLVAHLESQMGAMRSAIEKGAPLAKVKLEAQKSVDLLEKAQSSMQDETFTSWLAFTLSSSIILREGLEAFLVIITILSIIRAMKLRHAARWVHLGWITAIATGYGLWLAAGKLFSFSGAQRELMEGFIALFAVGVLLYVGFWMHSKSEAGKWQAYIKNKIQGMARKENLLGLALLSFMVVFREAFESVLFLSALSMEIGPEQEWAFGGGIIAAFAALLVISILLLRYSKKLPIPTLFKYSALVISVLAVILVGKGVHALQEAGTVSISVLPFHFNLGGLGLYATWETLLSQLGILSLIIVLWNVGNRAKAPKTFPTKTSPASSSSKAQSGQASNKPSTAN